MNIPRTILGTCAVGGFLFALLLHRQRVDSAPSVVADLPRATQAGRPASEAEIHNRELEAAIASERERAQGLEQEAARLAAIPADFRAAAIGARRKLERFAEKNQIPPNVLDRFSILVADKGYGVTPRPPPYPEQALARLTPEQREQVLGERSAAEKVMSEADASFAQAAIAIIGAPAFEAYKDYLPTLSQTEAIRLYIQPALGTNALNAGQVDALAEALVAQAPDPGFRFVTSGAVAPEARTTETTFIAAGSGAVVPSLPGLLNRLSSGALDKSSGILTSPQYAYLKQRLELNRIAAEIAAAEQPAAK